MIPTSQQGGLKSVHLFGISERTPSFNDVIDRYAREELDRAEAGVSLPLLIDRLKRRAEAAKLPSDRLPLIRSLASVLLERRNREPRTPA